MYDAMENTLRHADYRETDQGIHLHVTIEPYQMLAVVFDAPDAALSAAPVCHGEEAIVAGPWTVSKALASRQPVFGEAETVNELHSIQDPGFSGIIRYETTMECSGCGRSTLELEDCYEAAEVWINGAYAGMKIAPPIGLIPPVLCNPVRIISVSRFEPPCLAMPIHLKRWAPAVSRGQKAAISIPRVSSVR